MHKFKVGDKIRPVKPEEFNKYWKNSITWGDFQSEYTVTECDHDDVTPGYKLAEMGFRSLGGGSGNFRETWFELAPKLKGKGGKGKPGEGGVPGEGEGETPGEGGEGEGTPGEGEGEESKDSKEDNGEEMPKKKDKKDGKGKEGDNKDNTPPPPTPPPPPPPPPQEVTLHELPVGRLGRYTGFEKSPDYLYIAKLADNQVLNCWQGFDQEGNYVHGPSFEVRNNDNNYFDTKVEMLPIDTTMTLCFNGNWTWEKKAEKGKKNG